MIASRQKRSGSKSSHLAGRRFDCNIFTVKVGAEIFKAHETVLAQSPVLASMCSGAWKEGVAQELELQDDATIFGRVLEYLYDNNAAAFPTQKLDGQAAEELADMYVMADMYQVPGLKETIIARLDDPDFMEEASLFFKVACKLSANLPGSDKIFNAFFERHAPQALRDIGEDPSELQAGVDAGGAFAVKIFNLQAQLYRKARSEADQLREVSLAQGTKLDQLHEVSLAQSTELGQLREVSTELAASNESCRELGLKLHSFKMTHKLRHLSCKTCEVKW